MFQIVVTFFTVTIVIQLRNIFILHFLQLCFHTFLTQVIRLSHKHYLEVIENALSDGSTVLLENIGETVCMIEF